MKRTGVPALVGLAVVGAAIGWLVQVALTTGGSPSLVPPPTLYSVLFICAFGLLLLGRPVRRLVRGTAKRRVDPFFAMRVLVLAKASSLTGALTVGTAAALLVYGITRIGSTATAVFWPDVLTGAGGLALAIAGLVVESWCRIPPEDTASLPDQALEER